MDAACKLRRWGRSGAAVALVATATLAPRLARAGADEEQGRPWFPTVEEGAAPADVYAKYALSVVHVGEDGWRVNRGQYRENVSRQDFFVTVGRADLAARERGRSGLRNGFIWTGAGLAATGGLFLYASISRGGYDPPSSWGLGLMGAGAVSILIGSAIHGPDVTSDEVEAVVGRYNDLLKAHIEEETGTSKPKPVQARLELLVPFVDGRSGGGLLAVARF